MKCNLYNKILFTVLVSFWFSSPLQAMIAEEIAVRAALGEEVVGASVEEAFGEAGLKSFGALDRDVVQTALKETVGGDFADIGALPKEAQAALKQELANSFKALSEKGVTTENLFAKTNLPEISTTKTNFFKTMNERLGPTRGFSKLESQAIDKFSPGTLKEFPVKTPAQIQIAKTNASAAFSESGKPPSYEETIVNDKLSQFESAERNFSQAKKFGTESQVYKDASESLNNASKELGDAWNQLLEKSGKEYTIIQQAATDAEKTAQTVAKSEANPSEKIESRGKVQETENAAGNAKGSEIQNVRKSAKIEYDNAVIAEKSSTANLKNAESDLKAAQEDLKKDPANANKKAIVNKKQTAANEAKEANLVAKEDLTKAKAAAEQEGEIGVFGSNGYSKAQKYLNRFKAFSWEQFTNGVVMGFSFTIPNIVVSKWQSYWNNMKNRDATKEPQRFGDMWMQIPYQLISAGKKAQSGSPLDVKYLYVGLAKDPKAESVKRDDTISLKEAPFFMSRDDYDEYATAGIGDPNFPDKMVHLNSGFHFFGDGLPVPEQEVVQFLGSGPQWQRQNLQYHLNEQAGQIYPGSGSYEGSVEIADQFESDKNQKFISQYYSGSEGFGSVLNPAITALMNGMSFGSIAPLKIQGFRVVDKTTFDALGGAGELPENKPWMAFGKYVYQTADTSNIKSVITKLNKEEKTDLAKKIVEYVVMLDNENNIVPLQIPKQHGQYNFPTYVLNPEATKMLSLYDGTLYKDGKMEPSGLDVTKLIDSYFPQGSPQIAAMNTFIQEQLQYGPFVIGDKTLEIVDQALQEQGVYVYKIAHNDGVTDDYVVATSQGGKIIQLPGSPTNFVSLVTSRIYDSNMVPYDKKSSGRLDISYSVCKISEETPPIVVASASCKGGTALTAGLKAPLYSLFMDPDVNPNMIPIGTIVNAELRSWFEKMVGSVSWPQPPPVPIQWALSANGPIASQDTQGNATRIGTLLSTQAPSLRTTIDGVYSSWKKTHSEMTQDEREALSTFAWVDIVPPIVLRVTSKQDVDNGNHVYTSPFYPDEFLVLSNDIQGTQNFAQEYDVAQPQAYAISLSSGKIYSRKDNGEVVGYSQKSLETLLADAQTKQGTFKPDLLAAIKASKDAFVSVQQREQFGPDTAFGRFQFYLYPEDLKSGQFIYADVTAIKDPLKLTEQQLMDQVADYYVAIELKEGIKEGDVNQQDLNPNNWVYGNALSAKTIRVVSLVSGTLYDRGGGYQGYFKAFADNLEAKNLDIQTGFFNLIMSYLKNTWQSEGKSTTMRSALQSKITNLLNSFYQQLLAEKAEIEKALDEESKLYQPLGANTIANINAQPYIDSLLTTSPVRYLKKYAGKYYMIIPEQTFAGNSVAPQTYIDYNVGESGKDTQQGMYYDSDGNSIVLMTDWVLENARAYAGVVVNADGSQLLDVSVDHPSIPVKAMVPLDNVATLKTKLTTAWTTYKDAFDKFKRNPDNKDLLEKARSASDQVGLAKQEYEAARVASTLGLASSLKVYFNEITGSYFMNVGGTRYIDLVGGYQYYTDGTPKLFESPLLINKDIAKNEKMFLGRDQHDLLVVQYMTDRIETMSPYSSWYSYDTALDQVKGEEYPRYSLASSANNLDSLYVYNNKLVNEYYIYMKKWDEVDAVFTGTYVSDPALKYSLLRYFRTRTTGQQEGTYIEDRELDPTYIVWDGKPDLKFQQLYYRNYLLRLKEVGTNTFTAPLNGRTITVKKQIKLYGQNTTAHYITIIDGTNEYDFRYDSSILDPEMPTNCVSEDVEILKLNYWKQCTWNMNVVADAFGVTRLVKGSLVSDLSSIPSADSTRIAQQAGVRKEIVSSMLGFITYDGSNNRYLYKLSESRDGTWQYYQSRWNGWYVDLSTGILYTVVTPISGGGLYPLGSLHASQLYVLLDRLEVSVGNVPAADGDPLYKTNGEPVLDVNKQQIFTKPGLIYRSQKVIQTDGQGNMAAVLNQDLLDSAKASQATQF